MNFVIACILCSVCRLIFAKEELKKYKTGNDQMVQSVSKIVDSEKGSLHANARKDATISRIIVPSVKTMSTCESLNSPDVEYIDNNDIAEIDSIERKLYSKLNISDHVDTTGKMCKREILIKT
ncbi:uncharacterized protein [Rutidosis leptorrhynchoides]|uniref:uncharacterized protein isoform X1 n=1 Tax=Rutidosis leptorrhynchoides TaxID=125765 RepID=UPI003A98F520